MIWIVILSLLVNIVLLLKLYQDQKVKRNLVKQLEWIIDKNALAKIKHSGSSKSHDDLVNEINRMIEKISEISIESEEIVQQNRRMVSSISHDFRTPLTSMLGYVQILQNDSNSLKEKKYLKIIEERTKILRDLIEEFYSLSLLESNEYELNAESANPIILVQEQVAMYYSELEDSFDHISIQLIEEDIKLLTSPLDFNRLIGNLLKNAYTHGIKRFALYNEMSETSLIFYLENEVKDTNTIEVERLFERLYKEDKTRAIGSTGLGLSIAQKIAEALGYKLEASLKESMIQFKLTIPLK
ncbi:Signal transduction histidine kinase [Marinilactibacillus piezotolerans]|uniref:histidine kinase n=1 Tax=Marinilactibacillus piezotolerans TaxID=258723 RepID=A0A1I3VAK2_9LACT|nr:HAMP domain-containing sensor histidine kinase [Marinilactibacillus piezotolerans]SFJ92222.1 Signal transduction histidine kinase [Marinilactibacillus piezotolerans]